MKIIFLDRDGTINVDKHYLYKISEFTFLPGVIDGLKLLQDNGFKFIIVTNQSGIARGYYTESDLSVLHSWMIDQFKYYGIEILSIYYCPHLPDSKIDCYRKDCDCRKPKTGLFHRALLDLNIIEDNNEIYAIGDNLRDLTICTDLNCRGYLVNSVSIYCLPSYVIKVDSFIEAAKDIIKTSSNL